MIPFRCFSRRDILSLRIFDRDCWRLIHSGNGREDNPQASKSYTERAYEEGRTQTNGAAQEAANQMDSVKGDVLCSFRA